MNAISNGNTNTNNKIYDAMRCKINYHLNLFMMHVKTMNFPVFPLEFDDKKYIKRILRISTLHSVTKHRSLAFRMFGIS